MKGSAFQSAKLKLVYVVDDDEVIQYLTEQMFSHLDFCERSEFFIDPLAALENLKSTDLLPELILLDLRMPGIDGWVFLEELEKMNLKKDIPVFIFSSSINTEDIERSKKYRMVKDYIIKPLTVQKANKILRQLF